MFFQRRQIFRGKECVLPQSCNLSERLGCRTERTSLCALKKGSLTVEAALVMPFFLMMLLAFYQFFLLYASAAELKIQAAADAKKLGIATSALEREDSGEINITKTIQIDPPWKLPLELPKTVSQSAVCRGWIGFTQLENQELYVYMTAEGSVYHLYSDCTHLRLSIQSVSLHQAKTRKNQYGSSYRECEICGENYGMSVYITSEGDCYHSDRNCSGLKRTVGRIPISETKGAACCLRCQTREGE